MDKRKISPGLQKGKTGRWLFWLGIILLLIPGLVHAYLLMPFPGSQDLEAITFCYYLEIIVLPLRIAGGLLIIIYALKYFPRETSWSKAIKIVVLLLCLGSYYITDIAYSAEAMFKEPKVIRFANMIQSKVPQNYVVLGVVNNGVAKAYPLIYLGYHHKIQDNVGGKPVLVTYCTMCRTGMVFSPVINGKRQTFRLVGARHYNAVIEDEGTKSWWYQATGAAVVGPLKGMQLKELPYEQLTLSAWLAKHPASLILQPDASYLDDYHDLENYDRVQAVDRDSSLINKDSLVRKSWVLGVVINKQAKGYNWRQLLKIHLLNDNLDHIPLLVGIQPDSLSFYAWNRMVDGKELHFKISSDGTLADEETASVWDWNGLCTSGPHNGKRLNRIQAYQEYWHSWQHFHPGTLYW